MFKNYYLSIIGMGLLGIASIVQPWIPYIATESILVAGNVVLSLWTSIEIIKIHKNKNEKNIILTSAAVVNNVVSSTSQILKLIPPLQPDKDGKFNNLQNLGFSLIGTTFFSMWVFSLLYMNTQIEKPKTKLTIIEDKSQDPSFEETPSEEEFERNKLIK